MDSSAKGGLSSAVVDEQRNLNFLSASPYSIRPSIVFMVHRRDTAASCIFSSKILIACLSVKSTS